MQEKERSSHSGVADRSMASTVFAHLDANHQGLKSIDDETFVYRATEVAVKNAWELPIIIQYPDSTVEFEFTCTPGEISFGVMFVPAPEDDKDIAPEDIEIEMVEEMTSVECNINPITGSYQVPCEGVLFFVWENTTADQIWPTPKQISYDIEVQQPAFYYADQQRSEKSFELLGPVCEDLVDSMIRHVDAEDRIERTEESLSSFTIQVTEIQRQLQIKRDALQQVNSDLEKACSTLTASSAAVPGLCIRSLNKSLLSHCLSYLNLHGGVNLVCKYWYGITCENKIRFPELGVPILMKSATSYESLQKYSASNDRAYESQTSQTENYIDDVSQPHSRNSRVSISFDGIFASAPSTNELQDLMTQKMHPIPLPLHHVSTEGSTEVLSPDSTSTTTPLGGFIAQEDIASRPAASIANQAWLESISQVSSDKQVTSSNGNKSLSHRISNAMGTENGREDKNSGVMITKDKQKNTEKSAFAMQHRVPPSDKAGMKPGAEAGLPQIKNTSAKAVQKEKLLMGVKQIRSEQKMSSWLEYFRVAIADIDNLRSEKRRLKKLVRAWSARVKQQEQAVRSGAQHSSQEAERERAKYLKELQREYHVISAAMKEKQEVLDSQLESIGVDVETVLQLKPDTYS